MLGRCIHIVEDPVHPFTDLDHILVGLDVDITGIVAYSLGQHQVDQLDNRGVARIVKQVGRLLDLGDDRLRIFNIHILHDLVGMILAGHVIGGINGLEDFFLGSQQGPDSHPIQNPLQVINLLKVKRVGNSYE